jgi:flagellar assembly factor FliW
LPVTPTKYFGSAVEYTENSVIFFPDGLFGFEASHNFLLIEAAGCPLHFLQNLENPELCFLVMPATKVDPAFRLRLENDSRRPLAMQDRRYPDDALLVLAIVNLDEQGQDLAANLLAPLVIHVAAGRRAQVFQQDSGYTLRHRVPNLEEVASCS